MASRLAAAAVGSLMMMCAGPLAAQWPSHRDPSVPRVADGRVDLNAPAPRAADGHPDLSGVWENIGWRDLSRVTGNISGTGGAPPAPGTPRRPPPVAITRFFDLSSVVPGGLPLQPWAAALKSARMAGGNQDNPDAHCLPLGNMQLHTHPEPRKIIQTPRLLVILYEGNAGTRQIFIDGRRLPPNDPQPWWYGYSVGKWDGDTLVVETTGFRDGGWLDVNGSPLTDAGRTIERFRRPSVGSLTIDVTIDDSRAYTKPWSVTLTQHLMPDDELIEFVCQENERDAQHFVR